MHAHVYTQMHTQCADTYLWELGGGERVVLALGLGSGSIVKGCKRLPSCAPAACVSVAVEH